MERIHPRYLKLGDKVIFPKSPRNPHRAYTFEGWDQKGRMLMSTLVKSQLVKEGTKETFRVYPVQAWEAEMTRV